MSNEQNKRVRGKLCWYCGRAAWNLDHKIPESVIRRMPKLIRDGLTIGNKVPSCKVCNSMKGDKTPHEFRQEIRRWSELPTPREKRRQILEIVSSHGYKFFGEGWDDDRSDSSNIHGSGNRVDGRSAEGD